MEIKNPSCEGFNERLTLGFDFNLSPSIAGRARSVLRTAGVTRLYNTVQNYFNAFILNLQAIF